MSRDVAEAWSGTDDDESEDDIDLDVRRAFWNAARGRGKSPPPPLNPSLNPCPGTITIWATLVAIFCSPVLHYSVACSLRPWLVFGHVDASTSHHLRCPVMLMASGERPEVPQPTTDLQKGTVQ